MAEFVDFTGQWSDIFFTKSKDSYPKANAWFNRNGDGAVTGLFLDVFVPYHTKDQINLNVNETTQTITVESPSLKVGPQERDFLLREIPRGSFKRTFTLSGPFDFGYDKISADLNHGILRIVIPVKRSEVKTRRIKL